MDFFCDVKVAEISCGYSDRSNYHGVSVKKNEHDVIIK
jgi:hypothetical protein